MAIFRKAVAVVLLLVAVVFFVGPFVIGKADTDNYQDAVAEALLTDELNNERTEGAPQQQVVNGWTAIDFFEIHAQQNNDMLELQYRQMALLLVIALLVGWAVLTQRDRDERVATNSSDVSVTPHTSSAEGAPNQEPTLPPTGRVEDRPI